MFIEVIKAEYIDGYKIKLLFNNGETKIVDLFNYSIESWGMSPSFYKRLLEKKLIE